MIINFMGFDYQKILNRYLYIGDMTGKDVVSKLTNLGIFVTIDEEKNINNGLQEYGSHTCIVFRQEGIKYCSDNYFETSYSAKQITWKELEQLAMSTNETKNEYIKIDTAEYSMRIFWMKNPIFRNGRISAEEYYYGKTLVNNNNYSSFILNHIKLMESISEEEYLKNKPSRTIEVKLNQEHTAKVSRDNIVVGCQTFPVSIVKELQKAIDKLST